MPSGASLTWKKVDDRWVSTCGRYAIWVQARVRHGESYEREYAGSFEGKKPWLFERAAPLSDAKELCEAHARGRAGGKS